MRTWLAYLLIATLIIVPFIIWGEWFMAFFSEGKAIEWLQNYGQWAWAVAILLLLADLFLPLPGTVIMSALGYIYGPFFGGILATLGGIAAGVLAFALCRGLGRKAAVWILGEEGLAKGEKQYAKNGSWIVAISRWLPVLPELIACMAGLNQMKWRPFLVGLICGSIPLGFVFAYIGYSGVEYPYLALIISAGLPPLLWLVARYFLKHLSSSDI